jgi:hypothetical protein
MSRRPADILRDHFASVTPDDEHAIVDLILDDESSAADLARRTCACGVKVDGFYEYLAHLIDVLEKELAA